MVVKKISFVFIVLAIAFVGTAISSTFAADDAAKMARRDKMIAALKAEYEAKKSGQKVETAETVTEKISESAANVAEVKEETTEIVTEKVEEVKTETAEAVEETKTKITKKAEGFKAEATEAVEKKKGEGKCGR